MRPSMRGSPPGLHMWSGRGLNVGRGVSNWLRRLQESEVDLTCVNESYVTTVVSREAKQWEMRARTWTLSRHGSALRFPTRREVTGREFGRQVILGGTA